MMKVKKKKKRLCHESDDKRQSCILAVLHAKTHIQRDQCSSIYEQITLMSDIHIDLDCINE